MPTAIGHSRVYSPDQWPEQGYFVQAVYNNNHIWQELAPEYDQLIIRILRGVVDVQHAKINGLQDDVDDHESKDVLAKQTCEKIVKQLKAVFNDEEELQRAMELIYAT